MNSKLTIQHIHCQINLAPNLRLARLYPLPNLPKGRFAQGLYAPRR